MSIDKPLSPSRRKLLRKWVGIALSPYVPQWIVDSVASEAKSILDWSWISHLAANKKWIDILEYLLLSKINSHCNRSIEWFLEEFWEQFFNWPMVATSTEIWLDWEKFIEAYEVWLELYKDMFFDSIVSLHDLWLIEIDFKSEYEVFDRLDERAENWEDVTAEYYSELAKKLYSIIERLKFDISTYKLSAVTSIFGENSYMGFRDWEWNKWKTSLEDWYIELKLADKKPWEVIADRDFEPIRILVEDFTSLDWLDQKIQSIIWKLQRQLQLLPTLTPEQIQWAKTWLLYRSSDLDSLEQSMSHDTRLLKNHLVDTSLEDIQKRIDAHEQDRRLLLIWKLEEESQYWDAESIGKLILELQESEQRIDTIIERDEEQDETYEARIDEDDF